ncbi:MAG: hypothetical protein KBS60_01145 [Phascolarctobacterium sp.]|nr:hypothetical protein [Candidatus Phascolarctobacterium caballi]
MRYRVPFYSVGKALYAALAEIDGTKWFQASTTPDEVKAQFKGRNEYLYGIIGSIAANVDDNKDVAIWRVPVQLELYSSYKGNKVLAQEIEAVVNYFSDAEKTIMAEKLAADGFSLISLEINDMSINSPIDSDEGSWTMGGMQLVICIGQV